MPDTGFISPDTSENSYFTNPDNAFASDNNRATSPTGQTDRQIYSFPNFSIPSGATIDGVEIVCEAQAVSGNQGIRVDFSQDDVTYVGKNTGDFTTAGDTEQTVGGSTDTWFLSLTPTPFNNGSIRIRLQNRDNNSNSFLLDHVKIKVYYTQAPTYEQEGYRFRNDDGSESTATWIANQDTNITRVKEVTTRLRTLINVTNDPVGQQFQLEVRKKGTADDWQVIA